MKVYKPGEVVEKGGKFIEVGHGGGKIKEKSAKIVEVNDNEALPDLPEYEITINYKKQKKIRKRRHNWMRYAK